MAVQVSKLVTKFSHLSYAPKFLSLRNMTSVVVDTKSAKTLLYKEYGEPAKVLQFTTDPIIKPEGNQVCKMYYCELFQF